MRTADRILLTGRRSASHEFAAGLQDFRQATQRISLPLSLSWHDIAARYRGSILGPFWITISMGAMVLGIGVLYSQLFHQQVANYIPYIALGLTVWNFISMMITESADMFTSAAGMLKQSSIPLTTFLWRTLFRNLILLGHNLIIIAIVLMIFGIGKDGHAAYAPLALVGFVLVCVNLGWVGLILGIVAARFRDIPPVVQSVIQFSLFMTPVFWSPVGTHGALIVARSNPFYYMLEVTRSPVLGKAPDALAWPVLIGLAVVGWIAAVMVFVGNRRRLVHYI